MLQGDRQTMSLPKYQTFESESPDDKTSGTNDSGTTATNKRAVYEPKGTQRCKQLVCSQGRALLIVAGAVIFILTIALIASFARPIFQGCSQDKPAPVPVIVKPTEAIATNGEKFPWTDIRLPRTVLPQAYKIHLHPNLTTLKFNGSVDITVRIMNATDFIVLHAKKLALSGHRVSTATSGENIPIVKILEYTNHQQLYLQLSRTLAAGESYVISINFAAPLSDKLMGFYKSSYTTSKNEKRYLATTQFEPTDARAAFPCFDEPDMKATFQLSVTRALHYKVLFNMPRDHEDPTPIDGIVVDVFKTSVKMSTYLVAFVVCDYNHTTVKTNRNVTVSVYTPPEQIRQADFALSAATKVLDYYEDFFGVPYPLPKQDLIAIPDFSAGAMENWGLVTYRMTAILYDPSISSASNKQWVAVVIAHELAHQWFGNLVTMKWWNDLWLNEGFASFVEFLGADVVSPSWKMKDQFVVESLHKALRLDALSHSHPISVTVDDPDQISEIFDAISYDKGASIIRMLQQFLGENVLKKCLQIYLNRYKFRNAETDDLWNTCTEAGKENGSDIDVKQVMDTWTLQMGYPVVTVTRGINNKFTATQQRYLLNPKPGTSSEFKSPYNYRWHVPLTYVTEKSPQFNGHIKMMNMESVAFDVSDGSNWIKANVEQKGFYRVNYDAENWKALINQLKMNHVVFSPADRASLLDDAFAFSRSGHIGIDMALDMSMYLQREVEYVPWQTATMGLTYIGDRLADKPVFESFRTYVIKLMTPLLNSVFADWRKVGTMPHLQKFLASVILDYAVELNHEPTVQKARQIFYSWMINGTRINPDLKKAVYRAGVMYGGDKEWMFCWQKYKQTTVPSEKMKLLYAMTTTHNGVRLNRFLYDSLDKSKIRSQDTVSVVTSIAANPAGRLLAWRFTQLNWDTFMKRYGSGSFEMSKLIMKTTDKFSTQMEYNEVKSFFTEGVQVGSGRRAIQQALESIQMNTDWVTRNEKKVEDWLKAHSHSQ